MEESIQKRYFTRVMENQKSKRWCKNHLTGFWGVNPATGNYYARCSQGFRFHEECEIGENDN